MKKLLWIAFFLIFLLLCISLLDTYGLLQSAGHADLSPQIGKWNILLNDIDIKENKTITLNDLVYETNENVEPGFLAPGVTASYEIVIDPKGTDVSIEYQISMNLEDLMDHPNIVFKATDKDGQELSNDGTAYSGVIPLSSVQNNETITIKISLVWENREEHNDKDSLLIGVRTLKIPIEVKFSQYTGE